jgi:hypothetical protein
LLFTAILIVGAMTVAASASAAVAIAVSSFAGRVLLSIFAAGGALCGRGKISGAYRNTLAVILVTTLVGCVFLFFFHILSPFRYVS